MTLKRSYILATIFVDTVKSQCNADDPAWTVTFWQDQIRGTSTQVCDHSVQGDGKCHSSNNFAAGGCVYDGGDCCITTCYQNCITKQLLATGGSAGSGEIPYSYPSAGSGCTSLCGVSTSNQNCPYQCLSDDYLGIGSEFTGWCSNTRGQQTPMSECYSTKGRIAESLLECLMDSRSHGNNATSNPRCGNATGDCTLSDLAKQIDGCHFHPSLCTAKPCCLLAFKEGWVNENTNTLPSLCDVVNTCENSGSCFPAMAACIRSNKACKGGCCQCTSTEWFGPNCDQPLCWPKCLHGSCVAPNVCDCDSDWTGLSCDIPLCSPNCITGQGVCVAPNVCECFYGYSGSQCETPISTPKCVNGNALAGTDMCVCDPGWGGRICDYPICQGYTSPTTPPSSDCGHGVCTQPWQCKCEPGWDLTVPIGSDGLDIVPVFWNGSSDVSLFIPEADFVYGDTRFLQSSANTYTFLQYNAYKCTTPDCKLTTNPHCSKCMVDEVSGVPACTECDFGYYLNSAGSNGLLGECLQCSLAIPHCRTCRTSTVCEVCDPLFVLMDGGNNCVSDGIIEFSSPKYNVVAGVNDYMEIEIIRTIDSVDYDWALRTDLADHGLVVSIVTSIVPTESDRAVYASGSGLADYDMVDSSVVFSQGDSSVVVVDKTSLRSAIEIRKTVSIPIYDNLKYDQGIKAFSVKLFYDPNIVSGSVIPLRPVSDSAVESKMLLDEALVYIWDSPGIDYSTCSVGATFLGTLDNGLTHGVNGAIPIVCKKCVADSGAGCTTWSNFESSDNLIGFATRTSSEAQPTTLPRIFHDPVVTKWTDSPVIDFDGYMEIEVFVPSSVGLSFDVRIDALYIGIISQLFLYTAETAGQAPDIQRLEHRISGSWDQAQVAPAAVGYVGYMHFECTASSVPIALGFVVSQGGTVDLIVNTNPVSLSAGTRSIFDVNAVDSDWQAQTNIESLGCASPSVDGVLCYTPAAAFSGTEVLFIQATFKASPLYPSRPAGVSFLMQTIDIGATVPTWKTVPEECLYAGLEVPDSPLRGINTT